MARRFGFVLTILLGVVFAGTAARADEPIGGSADERFSRLVDMLANPSFAKREAAAAELRQAGVAARSALVAGLKHHDLEVQLRVEQLLARIKDNEFQEKVAKFLSDVGGNADYGLPGWKDYRQSVPDDRESREFFAEMLDNEGELLGALESGPDAVASQVTERVRWFQSELARTGYQASEMTTASMAALLLASANMAKANSGPNAQLQVVSSQLYSLLNLHAARNMVFAGRGSKQAMMLMETWIRETADSSTSYYGLTLAIKYNFKQTGREVARKALESGNVQSSALSQAAITLGRFGDRSDVELLEKQFSNENVCHTWSNRRIQKEPIRIQSRDVALAMAIHLTGQDVKDYGYAFANPNATTVFDIYTLGFLKDQQREAAFKKWREWKASQLAKG